MLTIRYFATDSVLKNPRLLIRVIIVSGFQTFVDLVGKENQKTPFLNKNVIFKISNCEAFVQVSNFDF
jgi:hypothetical protein